MDGGLLSEFLFDALYLVLALAAPALLVSVVVGFLIGLLSAATQIHDGSLVFVPRLLAVAGTLVVTGASLADRLVAFTRDVLSAVS